MEKPSGRTATVPASAASADPHPESPEPAAKEAPDSSALFALVWLVRVAVTALLAYGIARAVWQARGAPRDLAFIAGACAVLAALFRCLHLAKRLTPASPPEERRRLQLAVWALSTALSCAFAYRVSLIMPVALVIVIWGMTSFVVLVGLYILVLCEDQQYQAVDDVDYDAAAGDDEVLKKMSPADELV